MIHAAVLATVLAAPVQAPQSLEAFFRSELRPASAELDALERGAPLVRRLRSRDDREIALLGIVRIETTAEAFARALAELDPLLRVPELTAFGRIPEAADPDLGSLVFPRQDLEALATCRPGACDIKLPRDAMERSASLDRSAPGYHRRALALLREVLGASLSAYAEHGDAALITYVDKPAPAPVSTALAYLSRQPPGPADFGVGPPGEPPASADDAVGAGSGARAFFWTVAESGAQPVTQIEELVVARRPTGTGTAIVATIRQLYASHYYDGRLTRMLLLPPGPGDERGRAWLVYVDRSLFDGEIGALRRAIVYSRFERAVTERLRWFKTILEER